MIGGTAAKVIGLADGTRTGHEIAAEVGVTYQRVYQITAKYRLETRGHRHNPVVSCSDCGLPTQSKREPPVCRACHSATAWIRVPCLTCGLPVRTRHSEIEARKGGRGWFDRYKTRKMRLEHRWCQSNRTVPCLVCGTLVKLNPQETYTIKKGRMHGITCKSMGCRQEWTARHTAKMRKAKEAT